MNDDHVLGREYYKAPYDQTERATLLPMAEESGNDRANIPFPPCVPDIPFFEMNQLDSSPRVRMIQIDPSIRVKVAEASIWQQS